MDGPINWHKISYPDKFQISGLQNKISKTLAINIFLLNSYFSFSLPSEHLLQLFTVTLLLCCSKPKSLPDKERRRIIHVLFYTDLLRHIMSSSFYAGNEKAFGIRVDPKA